jgi:2-polyprenyl-3-methyl-5-hydroxy-6-metoxy-1,4-benzoquinol methylase
MMVQYAKHYYTKREGSWTYPKLAVIMLEICRIEGVDPKSFLDVGCASGCLLSALKNINQSATVVGIDHGDIPSKRFILANDPLSSFIDIDLDGVSEENVSQNPKLSPMFDVVSCIEVAEHIDPKNEVGLVKFISKAIKKLLFLSAAPVGQRGYGHINCANQEHWVNLFTANGVHIMEKSTRKCREMLSVMNVDDYPNMMVFRAGIADNKVSLV